MNNQVQASQINKGLPPVLLFIIVVALFFGSFTNDFIWHDKSLIEETSALSFRDMGGLFVEPNPSPVREGAMQYRPVSRMLLYLDSMLWGSAPFWYHIENILLHYMVVLLFYNIVLTAFKDIRTALLSSALFALHPIAVEPVNSVMAREGIISALFLMVSLSALLHLRGGKARWGILALLAFILSVLSLEHGIVFSVFLAANAFFSRDEPLRGRTSIVIMFLLVTASYFLLRMIFHGTEAFLTGLQTDLALSGLFKYFTMIVFPFSLHLGYTLEPLSVFSYSGFIAVACLLVLLAATVAPRTPGAIRAASIWILVFFIPFSNSVPYVSFPLADRYAYLALPGFCLLGGWGINALIKKKQFFGILLFAAILVVLGATTHRQNVVWKNDFLLWETAVKRSPSNARAYYHLARIHDEIHAPVKAISYYKAALRSDPMYAAPHIGLGNLYKSIGEYDLAFNHYTISLILAPQKTWIHLNLGDVYMEKEDWDRAIYSYTRYLKHRPDNSDTHYKIAVAFQSKGDYVSSISHYNEALSSRPRFAKARYDLSRLLLQVDDLQNARHELRLALIIDPNYSEARALLKEIATQ